MHQVAAVQVVDMEAEMAVVVIIIPACSQIQLLPGPITVVTAQVMAVVEHVMRPLHYQFPVALHRTPTSGQQALRLPVFLVCVAMSTD